VVLVGALILKNNGLRFGGCAALCFAMKKLLLTLALAVLSCGFSVFAQMGGPNANFGNGMEKLFGDNQIFSATMKTEVSGPRGNITAKAKMFFNHGDSRTEMDLADVQSASMPASLLAQMRDIGMDKTVLISSADKKHNFVIYPNVEAYAPVPLPNTAAATNTNFKVTATKLGDETVDGHPCVKNKTIVTDGAGETNEFTVWNASDLKNFPVKIALTKNGTDVTMSFQNVSFEKPASSLFDPPSNFTRYDDIQALMRETMMKHKSNAPAAATPNK
jgi:Domain of unknown function (DUF4412)